MLHTKTPDGTYGKDDYWTVSWINPDNGEEVVREYADCDNAYEDYCYYRKQLWAKNCTYQHHKK